MNPITITPTQRDTILKLVGLQAGFDNEEVSKLSEEDKNELFNQIIK